MKKSKTPPSPTEADIRWAAKHGWDWDGEAWTPQPFVRVIRNPMEATGPGWTPWIRPMGALQMEAPYGNVRAALRAAEAIRRHRPLGDNEMPCGEEA